MDKKDSVILTERDQSAQLQDQVQRLRWVSPGDVTYLFAWLLLSGVQELPLLRRVGVIDKVSTFLGGVLYAFDVHSTRMTRENLHALLGADRSSGEVEADLRRLLSLIAWNALMINCLPAFPREQIASLVPIDGISYLDNCLQNGRPTLIWGHHYGVHPLVVAAILRARGYPIHVVTHVGHMSAAASVFRRRYLQRLGRIGSLFPVINPREGVQRHMLDVLRNKEFLYVTPDYMLRPDEPQFQSPFTVPIDFLGRRVFLQTGGLRLAKRLGAQVVTVPSTQGEGGQRRLTVEPFELPTSGLTPVELQCDLQMCMCRLEAHVLARPHLWWDLKRDDLLERLTEVAQEKPDGIFADREGC